MAKERTAPGEEESRAQLIERILQLDLVTYRALSRTLPQEWLALDLTMSQLKVLFILFSDGPCRVGVFASILGVGLPTVTGILDRLVQQELVKREEDPTDRRVVISRLTEKGREIAERLHSLGRARITELLDLMSVGELRIVAQSLDIVHRASVKWQEDRTFTRPLPRGTGGKVR
ncbi:MAG: MarR family transcriptional regulator [Dehalococcoidia bacterium]|nr:MarR family transcriptional regulator [Dehalococcoidia bacterium]